MQSTFAVRQSIASFSGTGSMNEQRKLQWEHLTHAIWHAECKMLIMSRMLVSSDTRKGDFTPEVPNC